MEELARDSERRHSHGRKEETPPGSPTGFLAPVSYRVALRPRECLVQRNDDGAAGRQNHVAILRLIGTLGADRSAKHATNDGAVGAAAKHAADHRTRGGSCADLRDVT